MNTFTTIAYNTLGQAVEHETQKPLRLLQVATESYKSEQKTAKTETETTTPLYGKEKKSQIRDLRFI